MSYSKFSAETWTRLERSAYFCEVAYMDTRRINRLDKVVAVVRVAEVVVEASAAAAAVVAAVVAAAVVVARVVVVGTRKSRVRRRVREHVNTMPDSFR
jgi:hypothetical protein